MQWVRRKSHLNLSPAISVPSPRPQAGLSSSGRRIPFPLCPAWRVSDRAETVAFMSTLESIAWLVWLGVLTAFPVIARTWLSRHMP
jgi:hypothetical protein